MGYPITTPTYKPNAKPKQDMEPISNIFKNSTHLVISMIPPIEFVNNDLGVAFKTNISKAQSLTPKHSLPKHQQFHNHRIINTRNLHTRGHTDHPCRRQKNHSSRRMGPPPNGPIPSTDHTPITPSSSEPELGEGA
ncbi:unnamed protein product [Linum trigynum]|uniref:Uncharacterized protein n=1 Tax=Linum trigynum TaxID=586398 RepID=A0AAV2GUP7_9ROSI